MTPPLRPPSVSPVRNLAVVAMPEGPLEPLRLRPVPRLDGPFDDERAEPAAPLVHGSLALAFPAPSRVSIPLRLVPPAGGVSSDHERTRHAQLPDPRRWVPRVAQAVAEVLAGARPASQLASVATLDVLQLLERGAGRLGARPGRPPQRPVVGSVRVSEPCDGVAEACVVVDTGHRKRALALRFEGAGGQWRCTALQIG